MELYRDILCKALANEELHITFPNLTINATEIVELACYQMMQKIKAILEDDSLADDICFARIEEIVCLFEEMGSSAGSRHDFG